MNCLRLVSCLLAVGVLLTGCKNKKAEDNLATKKLLAQYCADFIPESALDMSSDSSLFLGSPQGLKVLVHKDCTIEDEKKWISLFSTIPSIKKALPEDLPWHPRNANLDDVQQACRYAAAIPLQYRGKAMTFLDQPLPYPKNSFNLLELNAYSTDELLLVANWAQAACADFVENAVAQNEDEMIATNRRLLHLRDFCFYHPLAVGKLFGRHIEFMRLTLWGWAAVNGLLSDELLRDKPFMLSLPDYRTLIRHQWFEYLLHYEAIVTAYTNNDQELLQTMPKQMFASIKQGIDLEKTLVEELLKIRSDAVTMLPLLTDANMTDRQLFSNLSDIAEKLSPESPANLTVFITARTLYRSFRNLMQLKDQANLVSTACDIELYRRTNGSLPASLESMIPDFCSSLPRSFNGTTPEFQQTSLPNGSSVHQLRYPGRFSTPARLNFK